MNKYITRGWGPAAVAEMLEAEEAKAETGSPPAPSPLPIDLRPLGTDATGAEGVMRFSGSLFLSSRTDMVRSKYSCRCSIEMDCTASTGWDISDIG